MIHIVFQEADIDALQKSFALDETMEGQIIQVKDDFAVGPLLNIYTAEGMEDRKNWWRDVLAGGDYDGHVDSGKVNDLQAVNLLADTMRNHPEEMIWIWIAPNKHDICGYYWLLNYLKEFQGRVFSVHLNNLPFLNEKGNLFYPTNLYEIPAKEFVKAKRLARQLTASEYEIDSDEWTRICNDNKGIRLLEGLKKLVQEDYDFYDKDLSRFITQDWQKASKIIHQYLHKAKHSTGDAYLLWRLKVLIAQGLFDTQGEIRNMKEFEVKNRMDG